VGEHLRHLRPISVLLVFSKILECAVHKIMVYKYVQDNKLLSSHQSGFCSLHSTSTCLTHATNTILHNIDSGLLTGLVFCLACISIKTHNLQARLFSSYLVHKSTVWSQAFLTVTMETGNKNRCGMMHVF